VLYIKQLLADFVCDARAKRQCLLFGALGEHNNLSWLC
jgi:hypothetical protein